MQRSSHELTIIGVVMLATTGCGGKVVAGAPAAGGTAGTGTAQGDEDAGYDSTNAIDAQTDAAADAPAQIDAALPDADSCEYPVSGLHACCEGKLCRGLCSKLTGKCACGGIPGGCWAPTACCESVCTSPQLCPY
jgi:hypothetical protein